MSEKFQVNPKWTGNLSGHHVRRRYTPAGQTSIASVCLCTCLSQKRQFRFRPLSRHSELEYIRQMRPGLLLAILALGTVGCADHNLLGEDIWPDERLARAEVSIGWNYEVESQRAPSRNVDILIRPNDSYQIEILEYQDEAPPETLNRAEGKLSPKAAARLRRSLARLRSDNAQDLFTTMPGCPEWSHPAIEYYVGFEIDEKPALTVLDNHCETPETVEGRRLVSEALAAFPQVNRTRLLAGSVEL